MAADGVAAAFGCCKEMLLAAACGAQPAAVVGCAPSSDAESRASEVSCSAAE